MYFFKSLLMAVLATILLTYLLGISLIEWLNIDITINTDFAQQAIEPLKTISISAIVAVALICVAVFIVFSVFGTLLVVSLLFFALILMLLLGAFWPIVFVGLVIWCINRSQQLTS